MTTGKMISRLRLLKKSILADGKVDWDETEQLLAAIRPLAERRGFPFEDYERLLVKCREDGKITADESRKLALQLDFLCKLCTNRRLTFWLSIAFIAALGKSHTQVQEAFRCILKSSVQKEIVAVRMEEAKRLLCESNQPISDIARACGFASLHYFSQAFTTYTGTAPSDYADRGRTGGRTVF